MRKRKCSMCDCRDTCVTSPLTCDKEFIILEQKELSKHDSELLDKVAEKIKCENPTLVPVPTIVWEKMVDKVITEQKAEVEK